jgi:hypothetical protein
MTLLPEVMTRRTFVIGDVHGHLGKLMDLLKKAGVTREDEVVQLGDLGNYDEESRQRDNDTWKWVIGQPNFRLIWGNHDAAVISPDHRFRGYAPPLAGTQSMINDVMMSFALERHGFLLSHAGLSPHWAAHLAFYSTLSTETPYGLSFAIANQCFDWRRPSPVRDAIGPSRGGFDSEGGILWRDEKEPLHPVPQIFGHSRADDIRTRGTGICIDVNAKYSTNLAGIWLPEKRVVAIGEDAAFLERALDDQADTH